METIFVRKNEATAARRRAYFYCVDATDGMSPETGEAGGQPQVSLDGEAFTNTGIGTLTHLGNGRYYADLTQTKVNVTSGVLSTRYKSANTAEIPGSTLVVDALVDLIQDIDNEVDPFKSGGALYNILQRIADGGDLDQIIDAIHGYGAAPSASSINTALSTAHGSGAWGSSGAAGGSNCTLTFHDADGHDIPDAAVWVTSDMAGATLVQSGTTSAAGTWTATLVAGTTYYSWLTKAGINRTNPVSFVAVAD
jgi:hypothetical protein